MDAPATPILHARCACGQRYRVRNPQAGLMVRCPKCHQPITLSETDLKNAAHSEMAAHAAHEAPPEDAIIPLQKEIFEPKEGLLLDYGELRLAAQDSTVGLTHRVSYTHEEALVASALGGGRLGVPAGIAGLPGQAEPPPPPRAFVPDLLASFYFGGSRNNARTLAITVAGCAVFTLISGMFPGIFKLILVPFNLLMLLCILQFCWQVLLVTAAGEDEIPLFDSDWNLWDDALKPLLWMTCIGLLCSAPAAWLNFYVSDLHAWKTTAFWLLLAGGWFFWPVAVMSVALGGTILFIRPDWLVRCVFAIGPAYLIAWLLVLATVCGWVLFLASNSPLARIPVLRDVLFPIIVLSVTLYCGFVTFRILGLLFRHFRARFPWKY